MTSPSTSFRLRALLPLCVTPLLAAQQGSLLAGLRKAAAEAPLVVAHRGASEDFPENTVAAFRAAVAAGAQVVEFDVHQTRDGAWVCLHDETCDRTTDAAARFARKKVRIAELTSAQVRELDAGAWRGAQFAGERLPTLAEALDAIFPAVPMIERKDGDAEALAGELRRLRVVDRVLVQAFDWDWLGRFHAAAPGCALGALGGKDVTAERLADIARTGASFVHWDHRTLRVEDAAQIRAGGYALCVYTVDPDVLLLGAATIGCDFVTTNRPARLVELRKRGLVRRPSGIK